MPVQVSINNLKENYPGEQIELSLENFQSNSTLLITPQGEKYQVTIMVWLNGEPIATGLLNKVNSTSDWGLEELAQILGISPDDKAWVMNDRI